MTVTIKWLSKVELFAKLKAVVPRIDAALTVANHKTATGMADMARRLAPHEDGVLQASIEAVPGPRPTSFIYRAGGPTTTKPVRDGADASYDYAAAQELGTRKMPANPFFWPAYRVVKRGHKGRVTRAIRKAVKEAGF